jgi:hypothetical protein
MSSDLRRYARQTSVRLVVGFILLLFLVGDGLIWYFYGRGAALFGLLCILGGLGLFALIGGILWVMERIAKTADR